MGIYLKNNEIVPWLTKPMIFVNLWRLPILFVVSGMGTRFAFSKRTGKQYMLERIKRLLIPLIFGILIVVPPQVYTERITQGKVINSYFSFYPHFFEGVYPAGNFSWHHLWFLPYLLFMSLIATPLFIYLKKENNHLISLYKKALTTTPYFTYILVIPLLLIEIYMAEKFPVTHAFWGDWYTMIFYFVLFISGFIFVSIGETFWTAVKKIRFTSLALGILSYVSLLYFWNTGADTIFISLAKTCDTIAMIIAIFGFSAAYLNKNSKILQYRNKAVYPFYILHQTITIVLGYYLMNLNIHYGYKFLVMTIGTFGFSWFIYEFIIRRNRYISFAFGVKK